MRSLILCAGMLAVAVPDGAQQPNDVARADSIARDDSSRVVRELEALRAGDSITPRPMTAHPSAAVNRTLPDVSATGAELPAIEHPRAPQRYPGPDPQSLTHA